MKFKTFDEIKRDMKASNAKVIGEYRDKTAAIKSESATKRPTGNKFLMILWGTILSLPLFGVGIVLFIMAALLFWDAIIGL